MGKAENDLIHAALEWLGLKHVVAWRNNTGAVRREHKGRKYFTRYGVKGMSDIFGILLDGRFLAAEAKATGDLSADQYLFIQRVKVQGGVGFMFRTLEELIENVEAEL